jgi:lysozyme family protein
MPSIRLSDALRSEYQGLFDRCLINPDRQAQVEKHMTAILAQRPRYETVTQVTGVPWYFIAVVHCMEASLDFRCHLHNGDPLTARTVQVPPGRPKTGDPPFQWEESAGDALALRRLDRGRDWSLPGTLYELEGYNGWGYRTQHPEVKSPYLWSFSNHYTSGKYVKDGTWSNSAISQQCGAAVLMRRMAEKGHIEFHDQPTPQPNGDSLIQFMAKRPSDPIQKARAEELQRWLNTFPGIFVKVDGWTGTLSSDAYRKVTGHYLPGDPRD